MIDREIASGAKRDPTQLPRLIKREAGDVVLVARLDRLARTRGTSSTHRGTIRTGDGPARAGGHSQAQRMAERSAMQTHQPQA